MYRPKRAPEASARFPVPSLWVALARLASLVFAASFTARLKAPRLFRAAQTHVRPHFASLASSPCSRWRRTRVFAGLRVGGAAAVEQRLQRKLTSNAVSWSSSGIFF